MKQDFAHLHVHSDYSLLDGCARIDSLCSHAAKAGMLALALTDHGNLFGAVEFFKTAKQHGLNPLIGCEAYLVYDHKMTERPERSCHRYYHMGLLAKNLTGYRHLVQLISDAHTKGMYYKPRTDMEQLARYAGGLIGFSGCLQGVIPQLLLRDQYDQAQQAMRIFIDIFGRENFFVEIQNHGIAEQIKLIPLLLKLARAFEVKVVCSNDAHYVQKAHWSAHDALLCIQTGTKLNDEKRLRCSGQQFYLKSPEEMAALFAEVPESLKHTVTVAEMCALDIPFGSYHYPLFPLPAGVKSPAAYLKELCIQGLKDRYRIDYHQIEEAADPALARTIKERINYELAVIEKTGFLDYFLIVWDFVDWARRRGIPVGPGRGSGAGCLVAYLLKITDIDPLRFKLLFERFLNPERITPPDFDIDFCKRRRDEVIDYVRNKYGADCVSHIITFGSFGAKMIVRDIARVLDVPYAEADRIAKMVPDDPKITLETALERSVELKTEMRQNPLTKRLFEPGSIIEGMVRNTGKHACGIIIADQPLTHYIPVTLQEGDLTTQYPKDQLEVLGLLKMDLLGLKTLTVIADAQEHIRRTCALADFDIEKVPLDDPETFKLLNKAQTIGIFQLESHGMQSLCRQFRISTIDEIIALIALYRPGPMELIPDYIRGKHDSTAVQYLHPLLEDICKETYGVMVYQEQVIEAARCIAGYSAGGADVLRHAMGKKNVEEMAEQRETFIQGAEKQQGIPAAKAKALFDLLEKFAGYGFNKSHSAAYAILAYRTAYLKANFPTEFMAAMLSSELGNADKVALFIDECHCLDIPVYGPDINESRENFTPIPAPDEKGPIRFGLAAIKGVGDAAAKAIISEREAQGPFKSFHDFVIRIDLRTVNRRVHECLIKVGAFDAVDKDRQHLLHSLEHTLNTLASLQRDKQAGQGLFQFMDASIDSTPSSPSEEEEIPRMTLRHKLHYEKELLGFYLSGHPMDAYEGLVEKIDTVTTTTLDTFSDRTPFRLCGMLSGIDKKLSKKDNRPWALFTLVTRHANFHLHMYTEAFDQYGDRLVEESTVTVYGLVSQRNGESRLIAQRLQRLDAHIPHLIQKIRWDLHPTPQVDDFLNTLRQLINQNLGPTSVQIGFCFDKTQTLLADIAPSLTLRIHAELFQTLRKHPAVAQTQVTVEAL